MNGSSVVSEGASQKVDVNSGWQVQGTGDFDGNGSSDVFWRNTTSGQTYIWNMNGTTVASQGFSQQVDINSGWQVQGTGDFNGDGRSDIFWRNTTSGQTYVWNMNGTTVASQGYSQLVDVNSGWQVQGTGDFNGDGRSDIFWRNTTSGQTYVWNMNGMTVASQGYSQLVDVNSGWQFQGTGDFNGDGSSDVFWRNTNSGQTYIWNMNGATVASQGYSQQVDINSSWQVQGIGDFNGDGCSDIFWRNATSGQTQVWMMEGTTLTQQEYSKNVDLSSGWQVQRSGNITPKTLQPANVAPLAPTINGVNYSYDANSTLTLGTSYAYDSNGWQDISKVDFWLTNAQGQRIELADATSFTSYNTGYAQFQYSTSLSGLAAGSYSLNAIAYDKSGNASNQSTQSFSITDWFESNLKDTSIRNLVRTKSADGQLDRSDLLSIFRDMEDGGIIDDLEVSDLRTLVQSSNVKPFYMSESMSYLSSKVASESYANLSATTFENNTIGKWFLGKTAPTATFHSDSGTTYQFQYQSFSGSLFGSSDRAKIGGIDQNQFGDCVLLASLGATFSSQSNDAGNGSSSTIRDMLTDNGDNTYTVRFYTQDRKAEWVTVDNRLATYNGSTFGASTRDGLWAPIIEKACAQWREFNEGYSGKTGWDIIGNGDYISSGLQRITGRVTTYGSSGSSSFNFNQIQQSLSNGKSIVVATGTTNASYLVSSHAYSVTNAYTTNWGEQRVVVRNPWGVDGGSRLDSTNDGFIDLSYSQFLNFNQIAIS
jgi:Calpain family cysteine protease/FG-GAP-like repeat